VKSDSETRVHALVGGFHMEEAEQEELKAAVRDLKQINADYILAGNCTGLRFQLEIEENLPNRFVRCFCGGEYIF
jgi:7,8-dihydropterin-6-yl-methyl-4-(beta-D-ribofuranosyl)aminobenzene 5'-phosphate synthase